jgi:hypothetical protein
MSCIRVNEDMAKELEQAEAKLSEAKADVSRLSLALHGMLQCQDASWEEQRAGHDWPEACDAARAALAAAAKGEHDAEA